MAAIENVFPPIPADTAVAVGAFLTHDGRVTALGVFLVTWVGNVLTAVGTYLAARTAGRRFFTKGMGRRLLSEQGLLRLERLYRRHGLWGIFVSRFIPAVRAVVPPFAGVAGIDAGRALVPLAVASALWYGGLTIAVSTLAGQLVDLVRLVDQANVVALIGAGVVAGAVAVLWWWGRRHGRGRPAP